LDTDGLVRVEYVPARALYAKCWRIATVEWLAGNLAFLIFLREK